jgi:GTP pyrophosphokinase
METTQLCPPALRESIAAARRALASAAGDAVGPGAEGGTDARMAPAAAKGELPLTPASSRTALAGELAASAEAAEILGALTEDADLALALLVRPLLHRADLAPGPLRRLVGAAAWDTAAALVELGDLGFPRNWSPEQGLTARQAEPLRKMLLAVVSDPRLVLARLTERLVALRHARDLPREERRRLALEARAVFAPLANRLGVWQLKWELEDLAFRHLEPEEYRRIAAALNERRADRERYIERLSAMLRGQLEKAGIHAEVYGRPKHMYSIFRKMQRKHLAFEQLFDVRAVRIVVDSVGDCYAALGIVHGLWPYLPGEFDDYIATPKGNRYRSIHTAVTGPEGKSLEVQIRTHEMHEHAELGVAAHWTYKEGTAPDARYQRKIESLRRLLEPRHESGAEEPAQEFLERVSGELFQDRIYALTPKGEVIELPRGATPLDFAYNVHSSLGHRCRGAKVNGRIVALTTPLSNGQIVEIITARHEAPSRDWLAPEQGFLASARNRAKVRAWFRKHGPLEQEAVPAAAPPARPSPAPRPRAAPRARSQRRSPVEIEGVGNLPITLARCCAPLRPQPITGYVTVGRGVTIHRSGCPSLARMRELRAERVLEVEWSSGDAGGLAIEIAINAYDRRGLVRDLTDVLAQEKLSIQAMSTTTDRAQGTAHVRLSTEVGDLEQLARIERRLKAVANVVEVRRAR